ncbi:hypothetical protein QO259_00950 [Salinicola sp. JS01]|uniref:hypothetical protein n=1 Tax=Salinicola sp. JS01 TaxID=3050071 RepID=UPI00255B867E|nr:hypothetical protein [Salinicola sp. JS01]WIX33258.1 hypothetical protein QO259_00950 [Salinicola sp. JS01]
MMSMLKRHPLLLGLIGLAAAFIAGGVVVSVGMRLYGGIQEFQIALGEYRYWLLVWRLGFYGSLVFLWIRFGRRRLLERVAENRDGGEQARLLLRKLERMILIVVVLIEGYNLFTWWEA